MSFFDDLNINKLIDAYVDIETTDQTEFQQPQHITQPSDGGGYIAAGTPQAATGGFDLSSPLVIGGAAVALLLVVLVATR